jgi:glycosyltransferase involved in cell wall biosynthesis
MRRKIIIDYRDEFEDYLIMNTRKWGFFYRSLKRFLTNLYRNATLVTPVTPAVAENLKRRGIHNVKVICDGVDTKIFQPSNKNKMRSEFHLPQESFVIAYLGNIYKPYRVDIVIRALKKLNEKDLKRKYLLILAGGGDVKSVLNLASNLGISDSVKYFGVIKNPTEIAKILSSADCGIIPYDDNPLWQKTYSTKLFEYCAVGLPVVGTVHENSALAAAIKVNKMGLIIPPINSDALASSLETLSADKELRIKMSLSALQFARTYDKEGLARDLLDTIENRH